jgi:hypothetical protein
MQAGADSDEFDRAEKLVAELKAIEFWDVQYWQSSRSESAEVLAFRARQRRRTEILTQLTSLATRLTEEATVTLGTQKRSLRTESLRAELLRITNNFGG